MIDMSLAYPVIDVSQDGMGRELVPWRSGVGDETCLILTAVYLHSHTDSARMVTVWNEPDLGDDDWRV